MTADRTKRDNRRSPVDGRRDHESIDAWFRRLAIQRGLVLVDDEDFFVTLLAHIDALTARAEKAEAAAVGWEACADRLGHGKAKAEAERDALRELLEEVGGAGVESVAKGRYIVVQIDLTTWAEVQQLRAPPPVEPLERDELRAALTDLYHARGKETMKVWDRVWRLIPQPGEVQS